MHKFVSLLILGLITMSLSACAGMSNSGDLNVKCPACGYEFESETKG